MKYIQILTKFQKATSFPFVVLYNRLLDYEAEIAAQTIIAYTHNLKGQEQFDPHDFSKVDLMHYFYIMILPFQGKTRVFFYVEKKYQSIVQPIIDDFNSLSDEDKLHFLFVSLVIYDEQFYISPALQERIIKDRKIVTRGEIVLFDLDKFFAKIRKQGFTGRFWYRFWSGGVVK